MGVSGFLSSDWLQTPLIHAKKLPEITRAGTESALGESRKFFYEVFSRLTGKRSYKRAAILLSMDVRRQDVAAALPGSSLLCL